jgi:predicted phosphoribosyltransferase
MNKPVRNEITNAVIASMATQRKVSEDVIIATPEIMEMLAVVLEDDKADVRVAYEIGKLVLAMYDDYENSRRIANQEYTNELKNYWNAKLEKLAN